MSDTCPQCARRAWLLINLSAALNYAARDLSRLWQLLALPDRKLIEALGGRRRGALLAEYDQCRPTLTKAKAVEHLCRHDAAYPASFRHHDFAPHTIAVFGGSKRLGEMLTKPVVAILGTRRASDYGMETARGLARGLASCGVTVASGLAEGIPSAVHTGALEVKGSTLTVMTSDMEASSPAHHRPLYRRIIGHGCAISEIQDTPNSRPQSWWRVASARTLALLAQLIIVVEANEHPWELACAQLASTHRKIVAAVPGRVSSPASSGTNSLLIDGAKLVRNPQDALDLLYGIDAPIMASRAVEPRLADVLERVGRGEDTLAKLTARKANFGEVTSALIELELRGLLIRGDGGRYLPSARALIEMT